MKKSLLTILFLAAAAVSFESNAKPHGMTPLKQEMCRRACMMKGDKWYPGSSTSGPKGCTCRSEDGNQYTITDSDMGQMDLDNEVGKDKK